MFVGQIVDRRSNRKRLGLLEKHKDYVERAKNYHEQAAELEVCASRQ